MSVRHNLATTIRRAPILMRIPYYLYRLIQPKYSIGVIGVVFNEQREVLLVEHVFHPQLPWGVPGGWIGKNEDPAKAVARELSEELRLSVEVKRLLMMERTQRNHLDVAYLCDAQNSVGDISYELLQYRWCQLDEMPRLKRFHYDAIMQAHALLDEV